MTYSSILTHSSRASFYVCFCLFVILFSNKALFGQTPAEKDQFTYVVELYSNSSLNYTDLKSEIQAFNSQYPNSQFKQYLEYLLANVGFELGDYISAKNLYKDLLEQDLHPDIVGDIYLNYAISCYYVRDYVQAIDLLETLNSFCVNPYYINEIHTWLGRIYALQGYYLSAEQEYSLVLQDNPDVLYDYFLILIKLNRISEAVKVLETVDHNSPNYPDFQSSWLEYLLSSGNYSEFDGFVASIILNGRGYSPDIGLLRVRKALEIDDYLAAASIIDSIQVASQSKIFFEAILQNVKGNPVRADSLFSQLENSPDLTLSLYSYLERLKIRFNSDPISAIMQLENYIKTEGSDVGEALFQLGDFYFRQGRLEEAVPLFIKSSGYIMPHLISDQNAAYLAETYYLLDEYDLCVEAYNQYLTRTTLGSFRDKALYYIGLVSFEQNKHDQAKLYLTRLIDEYPQTQWLNSARYYLAEIYFFSSQYEIAAVFYESIEITQQNQYQVTLRIAQTYYYRHKYTEALELLSAFDESDLDFDMSVLLGCIYSTRKEYGRALGVYQSAQGKALSKTQEMEAESYQAYSLYHLKRYSDASLIFYNLSQDSLNGDIYLYQAAKSAAQGKQWQHALDLFDEFVEDFPESGYFSQVQTEIANILFNLGRYDESLTDWLNILRRYNSYAALTEEDLSFLKTVFSGIEICSRHINNAESITQIIDIVDVFNSDYIKFELEYIIVKLYANAELWDELLQEATALRSSLNLPEAKRNDLEMLMVQSLINLSQTNQADSLASEVYKRTQSTDSLIQLAELAAISGNTDLALERYLMALEQAPNADLWLSIVDLSVKSGFLRFTDIWTLGSQYHDVYPQTKLFRLEYLFDQGAFALAQSIADTILTTDANPWNRAQAELWLGRIALQNSDYQSALRAFRKILLVYKEYSDVVQNASFYYIICLYHLDALQEGRLAFAEAKSILSEEQILFINNLLDPLR